MSTEERNLRPERQAMFNEVKESVSGALYMLLTDCTGMTVLETLEFKKQLKGADAKLKVVKNTTLNRLCSDLGKVTGPTSVISGAGDVVEVAKVLKKFAAGSKKPAIKGGVLEGTVLSLEEVVALADLPSKQQLQAKLLGTLAAPMTQTVGVMNQKVCSLLYVLNAVAEKKEEAA